MRTAVRSPPSSPAATTRPARDRASSTTSGCAAGTIATGTSSRRRQLFAQHARKVAESLEMFFGRRTYHDVIARLDDRAQPGDFARLVGAHLDHGNVRIVGNASSVSGTPIRLLRLPVVACTASALPSAARTVPSCSSCRWCRQRRPRADSMRAGDSVPSAPSATSVSATSNTGTPRRARFLHTRDDHAGRALGHCVGQKIVRVKALARERDEQVSRLNGPRVGPHPAEDRRTARQIDVRQRGERVAHAIGRPERCPRDRRRGGAHRTHSVRRASR